MKHFVYTVLLTLTCALTAPSFANAASFFEPFLGYRSENIKLTDRLNNQSQLKMANPSYGLKLGFRSMMGVDLNLAGEYSSGKSEWGPNTEKVGFKHSTAAVQLGINALGAMKIYLGYAFLNTLEVDKGLLNNDISLKGPAYQAGVQFGLFSLVSIGAQYNLNQFKNVSGTGYTAGEKIETYFNKIDAEDYSVNLSISF